MNDAHAMVAEGTSFSEYLQRAPFERAYAQPMEAVASDLSALPRGGGAYRVYCASASPADDPSGVPARTYLGAMDLAIAKAAPGTSLTVAVVDRCCDQLIAVRAILNEVTTAAWVSTTGARAARYAAVRARASDVPSDVAMVELRRGVVDAATMLTARICAGVVPAGAVVRRAVDAERVDLMACAEHPTVYAAVIAGRGVRDMVLQRLHRCGYGGVSADLHALGRAHPRGYRGRELGFRERNMLILATWGAAAPDDEGMESYYPDEGGT